MIGGLLVALGLAFFVSPLREQLARRPEKVAKDEGFDRHREDHALADSPLAGYGVEGRG